MQWQCFQSLEMAGPMPELSLLDRLQVLLKIPMTSDAKRTGSPRGTWVK